MRNILLVLVCAVLPLSAGTVSQTAVFSPADLHFWSVGDFDVVELAGYPALVQPGMPRIPRVVERVLIPAGAEPTAVELVDVEWMTIPGHRNLVPAQPDVALMTLDCRRNALDRQGLAYEPDPSVYAVNAYYPSSPLRLLESGTLGGFRIAFVEVLPVRWNPTTGELQLATRLSYRLTYANGNSDATVPSLDQREFYAEMVRSLVVNPQDVERFEPTIRRSTLSSLPPGHYEYVVISTPPLDTCFDRLVAWKTLKGVPATTVTLPYINANYSGYDTQEKIRNFIIDTYQNWGTRWVLLGGAADHRTTGQNIIPTRDCYYITQGVGYYNDEDTIPCDLYYGGLDGNWDANGNRVYGQRQDQADMLSEVFVGRATVNNVAQAQNFVNKTLTYEQNPPTGYLRKLLLPTAILWSSYEERPMQESIARMTPADWQDSRLYERTGTLSQQRVRDSMNSGFGLGHFVGHGDENGVYMGSSPYINSSDAQALTNGTKQGIHVSIACFAGAWDEVPGGDCFSEHLMNRVGGGAVGAAFNSRYGYGAYVGGYVPGPSERLDTVFFSRILNNSEYRPGQALAFSKAWWAPYADSTGRYDMQRFCIYELNYHGDPELEVWTAEPGQLTISHTGTVNVGNNLPYTVTVTAGGTPIEAATVLLWKGSEVYVTGRTNASGQVTLYVSPTTPGPMLLTAKARNHYLKQDTVQVIASQRYVTWLRSTIHDPTPGGNGDSILNPGEAVKLPTWLKNWGQQTANSVTARLRTHDPNVQITDSVKSFGSIGAGDSAWTGTDGFGLTANSGLTNGYPIPCSLVVRDALDSVWVSTMTFYVGAPVLQSGAVAVRDSARGNGNGKLDPGEVSDLVINLQNTGLGHGYDVRATLASGDARLTVVDNSASWGTVRAGAVGTNETDMFVISAAAGMPLETSVTCTLHITADGGYAVTRTFVIVVGEIRAVDPIPDGPRQPARYYAYDNSDTSYEPHPTYNWIEINTVGTRLTFSQNDAVVMVSLPTGFGPVKFYGNRYTQISISADGWIAMGNYTTTNYTNVGIPSPSAPRAAVFANWDDLYPVSGGGGTGYVYWYHDAANHRLIVEYDSVGYYSSTSTRDKFQIIFYDTTVVTPSGDNAILVQYKTAVGYGSSTLGMQDQTQTIGIQNLFDGAYHRGCAQIAAGRAILYTTTPPFTVGVEDEQVQSLGAEAARFRLFPNPVRSRTQIAWHVPIGGQVSLRLYDATGRLVHTLVDATMSPGDYLISWDRRVDKSRTVAPGVYFCQLSTPDGLEKQKLVVGK